MILGGGHIIFFFFNVDIIDGGHIFCNVDNNIDGGPTRMMRWHKNGRGNVVYGGKTFLFYDDIYYITYIYIYVMRRTIISSWAYKVKEMARR